jgi:hypothetical protein
MSISIRVLAKTVASEHRTVIVTRDGGAVSCDCDGFGGVICSHVDAVLIAEERAMVHPEDRELADVATALVRGRIVVPDTWRAAWRKNLRWRGLSSRGSVRRVRDGSKPLVCFTGTLDRPRAELIAQAQAAGWETIDSPSPFTDVLVAADPLGASRKLKAARTNRTPIVTCEEWSELMHDGELPS